MKVTAIGKKVTVQKDTDIAGMMTDARLEFSSIIKRCLVLDSYGVSPNFRDDIDCVVLTSNAFGNRQVCEASVALGSDAWPASLTHGGQGEIEFEDPPDE